MYARFNTRTARLMRPRASRKRSSFIVPSVAETGPEPAPVEDEIGDRPDREYRVDDDQPAVDAAAPGRDFALRVLLDVVLVRHRPARAPRATRRASRLRCRETRRSPRPTRTRTAPRSP